MSKKFIARTDEMSHDEWLAARNHGIGGSDVAAAVGMSRWKSPFGLWVEKTTGTSQIQETEPMRWGTLLEPVIRKEFATRTGKKVEAMPWLIQSEQHPHMLANIDGIVREDDGSTSLLEIKCVSAFKACEWSDGLPPEYYLQVQHYLSVCELQKAYIAYLIGGNDFHYVEVGRDEETIQMLIALEAEFWHHVTENIKPAVDDKSADALAQLYPQSNKTSIILPDEADAILEQYVITKKIGEDVAAQIKECENQLKQMLGDAECGKSRSGYSVSWKSTTSNRLDSTALRNDHPEIAAQYTTQSSSRRFNVVAPKPKKEKVD